MLRGTCRLCVCLPQSCAQNCSHAGPTIDHFPKRTKIGSSRFRNYRCAISAEEPAILRVSTNPRQPTTPASNPERQREAILLTGFILKGPWRIWARGILLCLIHCKGRQCQLLQVSCLHNEACEVPSIIWIPQPGSSGHTVELTSLP